MPPPQIHKIFTNCLNAPTSDIANKPVCMQLDTRGRSSHMSINTEVSMLLVIVYCLFAPQVYRYVTEGSDQPGFKKKKKDLVKKN